jgi:hypothetical protein
VRIAAGERMHNKFGIFLPHYLPTELDNRLLRNSIVSLMLFIVRDFTLATMMISI